MDFQAEFNRIIENANLDDVVSDAQVAVSLLDLTRTIEALQDVSMHLTRYCSKVISVPRGEAVPFPADLMPILPQLSAMSQDASDILHVFVCEECGEEDFEDDE